ncbi:MAG: hypothetical protein QOJ35_1207 [Solirubrobacteraceae bacterium]|jgi:hypothetical protein|nr:hypothetical protein [Solirubrobacteraceae bacterium]
MLSHVLRASAVACTVTLTLAVDAAAALCPTPAPPCPFGGGCAPTSALPADGFVDSIGVNTHMSFAPGNYTGGLLGGVFPDWSRPNAALRQLGIRHVRDHLPPDIAANGPIFGELKTLAATAIKTDVILPPPASVTPTVLAQLATLKSAGVLESVEPVNEIDNAGATYAAVGAQQPTIHATAAALGVPALGPSLADPRRYANFAAGSLTAGTDQANLHIYGGAYTTGPGFPYTPGDSLQPAAGCGAFAWGSSKPVVVGETGYATDTTSGWGVSPAVQATYVARLLLSNYADRVKRTYLYELGDEAPYQVGIQGDFGIMTSSFAPKPAGAQVTTLTTLLADRGQPATTAARITTVPAGTAARSVELFKRDGSRWLALWQDAPLWDPFAQKALPTPPAITLTFTTGSATAAGVYRLSAGTVPVSTQPSSTSHTVTVRADDVTLVKLT